MGPGAENAFGGVAQSYADSVPAMLSPAGAARRRAGADPVFSPTRSYDSITKSVAQINFADRAPELMRYFRGVSSLAEWECQVSSSAE